MATEPCADVDIVSLLTKTPSIMAIVQNHTRQGLISGAIRELTPAALKDMLLVAEENGAIKVENRQELSDSPNKFIVQLANALATPLMHKYHPGVSSHNEMVWDWMSDRSISEQLWGAAAQWLSSSSAPSSTSSKKRSASSQPLVDWRARLRDLYGLHLLFCRSYATVLIEMPRGDYWASMICGLRKDLAPSPGTNGPHVTPPSMSPPIAPVYQNPAEYLRKCTDKNEAIAARLPPNSTPFIELVRNILTTEQMPPAMLSATDNFVHPWERLMVVMYARFEYERRERSREWFHARLALGSRENFIARLDEARATTTPSRKKLKTTKQQPIDTKIRPRTSCDEQPGNVSQAIQTLMNHFSHGQMNSSSTSASSTSSSSAPDIPASIRRWMKSDEAKSTFVEMMNTPEVRNTLNVIVTDAVRLAVRSLTTSSSSSSHVRAPVVTESSLLKAQDASDSDGDAADNVYGGSESLGSDLRG